jgi:hypothetical protein
MNLNELVAASRITQSDPIGLLELKGGDMKYVTGFLAAIVLILTVSEACACNTHLE